MITMQGTVPFPQADASKITRLASDLKTMSGSLGNSAAQVTQCASSTQATWVGQAGDSFRNHLTKRSATMASMGQTIGRCAPVLDTYAAAILSTQAAYSSAAVAERAAQAGMPWTSVALAAAIAAEGAAVAALQVAGVACAGALVIIELELLAAEFLGVSRAQYDAVKSAAVNIWDDMSEAIDEGDIDAAISALNTTVDIPNRDGTRTRYNPLGMVIDQFEGLDLAIEATQVVIGGYVLLTAPPLSTVERPDLVEVLVEGGFTPAPSTASQHGENMSLLEELQRQRGEEVDQSTAMFHTRGIGPDGRAVMNLTLPGMVRPDEGLYDESGVRNFPNAAAEQIARTGAATNSIREWVLAQDLPPGSTINMFAHSQGGIISRNVANDLAELGYDMNVVSYGSPDGDFHPAVDAYVVQNSRDPVPLARLGGDFDSQVVFTEDQRLIQFDHELAEDRDLFDHHDARVYGEYLDDNPEMSIDAVAFQAFLADQQHVNLDGSGVVVFEGPDTPQGAPVTVPEPYSLD